MMSAGCAPAEPRWSPPSAGGSKEFNGRNWTVIQAPAGDLGTACSQVRWQEPPITIRSPWPSGSLRFFWAAAGARAQEQLARFADGQDGDHGVLARAASDRVAVPGHAVAAVAVVAAAGGGKGSPSSRPVVRGTVPPAPRRGRGAAAVVADPVGAQQAGYVDDAARTSAVARPARARRGRASRRGRRPGSQPRQQIDPGAAAQRTSLEPGEVLDVGLVGAVRGEEGRLEVHPAEGST